MELVVPASCFHPFQPRSSSARIKLRLHVLEGNRIQSVTLAGKAWTEFDPQEETVTLPAGADAQGLIAPWHRGLNGQLDERLCIAVGVLKRYPWVDKPKAVMAAPDFVYNSHWSIRPDGAILIPPTTDWMCGHLCQRARSVIKPLTAYYQYSGDPIAFIYIPLTVDYILDYGLTDEKADWPLFPISTPTRGKAYGKCDPRARNQLDLCAIMGREAL